jgi:Base plate wedge protein 53
MKYFQQLPTTAYIDFNGKSILLTDLLVRVSVIPELLKNPLLYYQYDCQEGDTPEIIATKYYGTPDDFWLVMFANQLNDPEWDLPLSYANLQAYITDKYGSITNAQSQIINYEKIVTTYDSMSGQENTVITIIDEAAYANTATGTQTGTLPSGDVVSITTMKQPVYAYDYEIQQNESKRTINLINVKYAATIKAQLTNLLNSNGNV